MNRLTQEEYDLIRKRLDEKKIPRICNECGKKDMGLMNIETQLLTYDKDERGVMQNTFHFSDMVQLQCGHCGFIKFFHKGFLLM